MKTMTKRLISIVLTIMMLMTSVPFSTMAVEASDNLCIYVAQEIGFPGETVDVEISIRNNPGLGSLKFDVEYGDYLTLENVTFNTAFGSLVTAPTPYTNPQTLSCMSPLSEITAEGVFATLTFAVSEDAPNNYVSEIEISYNPNDICDGDLVNVDTDVENGKVTICHRKPGDANGDDLVDNKDAILVFRHSAGWDVNLTDEDKEWMDVNGDFYKDNKDAILIFRASAGWDVKLLPPPIKHVHDLTAVDAIEATCTEDGNIEYWSCRNCGKYFEDEGAANEIAFEDTVIEAKGHTEQVIPSVKPTDTEVGYTEGKKCTVCGAITVEPIVIPTPNSYAINYDIYNGDSYLSTLSIENPNRKSYKEDDVLNSAIDLIDLTAPAGYRFLGWYDGAGDGAGNNANKVRSIPQNATGDKKYYAHWSKIKYTVTFDSPDCPVEPVEYTVDKGVTLDNPPKVYKYTFIGWSNDEGFVIDRIRPGTIGDMTLRANWTSDRNRATSYSDYGDPIIIEDNDRKQFLFVYDIGKIDNVPLYTYKRANGELIEYKNTTVDFTETSTSKTEFKREDAQNIAKTVANATTRSSGWTLSEEWESVLSESQEDKDKLVKSEERTDSKGNTVGGKYFISNSEGGSSYSSVESGSSSSSSARVTTEDSFGINTSYDKSTEKYCDSELKTGFKNETELSAGISAPIGIAKVEAGVKNTTTITADAKLSSGRKDNEAFHADTSSSSYIGTDFSSSSSSHYNAVTSNSTNWNSSTGYEKSDEMSQQTSVAEAIAKEIESTTTYNISNALSGAKDNTESVSGTTSDETGYSNSVTVSEYFSRENVHVESHKDDNVGYHRLVEAGIVHVYAVVGYDIATASYYTYTFNVLEDNTYKYWDYSLSDPSFKDCENGLVTFDIPYEVNEYISGVTGQTEGLEIEIDNDGYGSVKAFDVPENFSGDVVVPQYLGADNLDDTFDPVVVTSFSADAFRGNENIKTVILPMYVTEIPDYAFEGCINLETVIAYGVTKIGDYAFKDCVKLGAVNSGTKYSAFMIDNMVTEIGTGAFEGVNEIKVMAYDSDVADAAINSGSKKITVDLTKLKDSYSGEKLIGSATEYFKLIGGGKTFKNLRIKSDAKETFISNMTLTDNTDVPLKLSSSTVTLARVNVEDAPGIALHLSAENTALKLYQTVTLTSKSNNSVLSKNVSLSKANSGITGTLDFSGKYLVCGEITNTSMLKYPQNVKVITEGEYNKYLGTVNVSFDTDEGSDIASVEIAYDTKLEEPASPKKDHYSFLGWYTDEECTTEFDFDTPITSDITLYAKWKLNEFNVSFNANGGNVSQTAKEVIYGEAYGTLPTPSRTGYSFNGWYTAAIGGTKIAADTTVSAASDHTLYAQWTLNTYKVSWSNVTGVTISVKRTESPYANAQIGSLTSGNTVNYGDVLSVTYSTQKGYTKTSNGKTTLTVTGNITSEHIYANATLNSYKVNWTVPTGGSITVKRTSSPLAGATTGTLSSGNTVYHGDVLAITYSANTGYSVATKGKTSVTVAGNITNSDIYLTVTPNDYTYNIVYKSSNGTALGTDTVTKAFATTNTVTPKTFAGYDTPASQSVKWDATSKTITFTYTPTSVAPKTISKSKVIRYKDQYVSIEAVIEHQNRTKNSIQIRINWTVIHNGPLNMTFCHGITAKSTIGSVSNTTKITSYTGNGHVKDQRYSKATDWITVPLDSTQASSINIAVSTWQTNSNGTNISSGGGSNYTNYTDTWSIDVPAY